MSRGGLPGAGEIRLQEAALLRVGAQRGGIGFSPGCGAGQHAGGRFSHALPVDPEKLQAKIGKVAVRGNQLLVKGEGDHFISLKGGAVRIADAHVAPALALQTVLRVQPIDLWRGNGHLKAEFILLYFRRGEAEERKAR